ncbi:putative amidohydrolase YtcJ [Acropora palmata]|uniref:putative amidohydrolase YtcJ n=1 Tax=Acropora palmata TaxID=6131 RepID=UPI003D9FDFBD
MTIEIAELVKQNASALPWGRFFGWDPELIPNMPKLSADFLDEEFSRDIPVAIVGQSGHVAWVNHKAFEIAGVEDSIENEHGGVFVKDEDGHLTGQLFEDPAITRVLGASPKPTPEELESAVWDQWKDYSARGFTTVTDLGYMRNKHIDPLLEAISLNDTCPVRLALYRIVHGPENETALANRKKTECCLRLIPNDEGSTARSADGEEGPTFSPNPKLWEAGVKVVADGSPHCGSAAVREPFLNSNLTETLGFPPAPCYGNLNYSTQDLLDTVKFFHQQGTQIAIHAHGERAIDQVIGVYEQVLNESEEPKDMRHRVEHLGLCTVDDIVRSAKLNLALSFFVCHLYFYAKSYTEHIFGAERTNRWTPLSEATKHGLRWSIHQDHATFPGPPLPFANLKTAVTRAHRDDKDTIYGPEYCVSIHEAMKAVTIDAAWQIHKDDILGSLTKNKRADLLILSKNPYEVDPFELEEIKVLETFTDGRRNELNKTYPVNFPGGTVMMYAKESSERKGMDGPVKSMKRKGGSSPMRQERKTAKSKRH